MSDWIGLGVISLFVIGTYLGYRALSQPYRVTPAEFERRVNEGGGLGRAGMIELQKVLDPAASRSIEVVQTLKDGRCDKKQAKGDGQHSEQEAVSGEQ